MYILGVFWIFFSQSKTDFDFGFGQVISSHFNIRTKILYKPGKKEYFLFLFLEKKSLMEEEVGSPHVKGKRKR